MAYREIDIIPDLDNIMQKEEDAKQEIKSLVDAKVKIERRLGAHNVDAGGSTKTELLQSGLHEHVKPVSFGTKVRKGLEKVTKATKRIIPVAVGIGAFGLVCYGVSEGIKGWKENRLEEESIENKLHDTLDCNGNGILEVKEFEPYQKMAGKKMVASFEPYWPNYKSNYEIISYTVPTVILEVDSGADDATVKEDTYLKEYKVTIPLTHAKVFLYKIPADHCETEGTCPNYTTKKAIMGTTSRLPYCGYGYVGANLGSFPQWTDLKEENSQLAAERFNWWLKEGGKYTSCINKE